MFLIIGMINTKDPVGYFRAFMDLAEQVFTVPIRGSDAGLDPVALASDAAAIGFEASAVSSVAEALTIVANLVDEDPAPPRILIGGSLYLVGDVLADNGTPPK
ncbi:hypothetical protein D9M70_494170 [compost metagenome]